MYRDLSNKDMYIYQEASQKKNSSFSGIIGKGEFKIHKCGKKAMMTQIGITLGGPVSAFKTTFKKFTP